MKGWTMKKWVLAGMAATSSFTQSILSVRSYQYKNDASIAKHSTSAEPTKKSDDRYCLRTEVRKWDTTITTTSGKL
jgi:hypothetical protein